VKKRISILLPSRGRPRLAERFLASAARESTHPELIEVILCVDEDDVESHAIGCDGLALKRLIVPRQSMGMYNSICLAEATGDIIVTVNDDIIVRTKGWDERIRATDARFPDGIYLGYSNDLFKQKKLCSFPILSRRACEVLVEPYPPAYRGAFLDTQLMDIFYRLKQRGHDRFAYDEELVFEHVHYRNHPEAFDATYAERQRFGDDPTFIALIPARKAAADRLLAAISNHAPAPARDFRLEPEPVKPVGFVSIVFLCGQKFLLDFDLPLTWRCYLFGWMIARYYYSRLLADRPRSHRLP
jgi:hypothetical protein